MEKGNSILTRLSCTCHLSNETIMQFLQMKSQLNCTTVSLYFHTIKIQNSKCPGKDIHWKKATKVCAFDCHLQLISHTPPQNQEVKNGNCMGGLLLSIGLQVSPLDAIVFLIENRLIICWEVCNYWNTLDFRKFENVSDCAYTLTCSCI